MSSSFDCPKCGASLPLPADPLVTVVRCRFCATDHLAPGLEARQHGLASHQSPVAPPQFVVPASGWSRWLFLPGVLFVGFCFVAVFSGLLRPPVPPSAQADASSAWDGAHTLECTGKQQINLDNVHAKMKGVAIHADGRCILNITGGTITADTAIVASGHALVSLEDVVVDAPIAVDASENAQVVLLRSRTKGRLMTRDQASVREL